jgi:hypothetical protein
MTNTNENTVQDTELRIGRALTEDEANQLRKEADGIRINSTYTFDATSSWHALWAGYVVPLFNETIEISYTKPSGSSVSQMTFETLVAGQPNQSVSLIPGQLGTAEVKSFKEYYVRAKATSGSGTVTAKVKTQ